MASRGIGWVIPGSRRVPPCYRLTADAPEPHRHWHERHNRLAEPRYNFTVFGKVVQGMDVVDRFVQVGDPSGGLDQARLWTDGDAYLASLPVKPR
jgi:cyclophilin family peptidyl-prolyl cis-trans isomerase